MKDKKRRDYLPIIFSLSAIPDNAPYQAFTFLVFTYYFAVVGINMWFMWIAYTIWGIWNAVNDPVLGALSDRTRFRAKFGKRKLWIIISLIPLSLSMIFLFTVPLAFKYAYFLFIILFFEGVYTMYSVNVNALFPEMFTMESERRHCNLFVKGFTICALVFAFILPTLIIKPLVPLESSTPEEIARIPQMYIATGAIIGLISLGIGTIFISFGIKERHEKQKEFEKRPGFLESLRISIKNVEFIKFVIANTCIWYNFGILPTVFPLFSVHVVGIEKNSIISGVALMLAFLLVIFWMPLHKKIAERIGSRNALALTCLVWIGTLFPYVFLSKGMMI
ncbi:MAG: MFS transporter, partial [Promethearchaeota archaeon]